MIIAFCCTLERFTTVMVVILVRWNIERHEYIVTLDLLLFLIWIKYEILEIFSGLIFLLGKTQISKNSSQKGCTDRELNPGYWLGRPKSYH